MVENVLLKKTGGGKLQQHWTSKVREASQHEDNQLNWVKMHIGCHKMRFSKSFHVFSHISYDRRTRKIDLYQ